MAVSYKHRERVNMIAFALTGVCALVTLSVLFFILGYVTVHGISSLNWDFFTKLPAPVGEAGGGMANAIVGTFELLASAGLLGVPTAVLGGIFLAEYGSTRLNWWIRFAADVLNGVPSIIWGMVVYGLVVVPLKGFSALAGSIVLGMMMLPLILRTTEEVLLLVPTG